MPARYWAPYLALFLGMPAVLAGEANTNTNTNAGAGANRLVTLDDFSNPYSVGLNSPRLTTPMWVGDSTTQAVVVLAIDDMTDNAAKYESYLRPILDRLKRIDGRAAVSIMTCRIPADDPLVARWLAEGVNLDVHTLTHPCPLLQKGDFAAASRTVHEGLDRLAKISGNHPVAYRMPCCDSKNTPSPRFYSEIFNATSSDVHTLSIDSSVFNLFTPDDPSLPRELVEDPDGRSRFRKYLPFPSFVNTIENYPYPYVIGRMCWEFPCVVPSDWEAQNLQKPNNPRTVEDLKAALDATVIKQGVFCLVFHPHGWIQAEQIVELIDHATTRHGDKVKFLNFREAHDRLNTHLLAGQPLREASGGDNGIRLTDINNDGFVDVLIGNAQRKLTRIWNPANRSWTEVPFPTTQHDRDTRLAIVRDQHRPTLVSFDPRGGDLGAWTFDTGEQGRGWVADPSLAKGLETATRTGTPRDRGARFRDLDGDGRCEVILANAQVQAVLSWSDRVESWTPLPFSPPTPARFIDSEGRDAGLRLIDLDEDGLEDLVFSNDEEYGVYLFDSLKTGWSRVAVGGKSGEPNALPRIVSQGKNNGFWVHSRSCWWQNEHTASLADHVDRRSFNDLLANIEPRGKSVTAALRSIRVRPGLRVELMAAEPLIADPIAFDWDARGRLWVVEMGDYPSGLDGKGKPGGVVRVLEDTDGDTRYDKSTTFLDGLGFPTGLIPWRDGVIIACAPDIFFARDTNGDLRADERRVLFTGFGEGNQQHRLNGFELGLDGWIYGANGDSGGKIKSLATGKLVDIRNRDFRFDPDTGAFEAESGQTQFGRHRDDAGRWFGNNNPTIAWEYVLHDSDLQRNPFLALTSAKQILDLDTIVHPISRTLPRFNDLHMSNRITSANSPTPYRDELLGPAFANNLFVSEPVHNLIRRVVLDPSEGDAPVKKGHRAGDERDREFLASSDHWFRPTMMKTGPDGALWIADMDRAVIEHPQWIPDDWERRIDLRAGADRGRIFRVVPIDRAARAIPRLDALNGPALAARLESPNGWQRDTVQRLLMHDYGSRFQRSAGLAPTIDHAVIASLVRLSAEAKRPVARLQALATLDSLGVATADAVEASLGDAHPDVRALAVQVARRVRPRSETLESQVLRLASDNDARVRLQVALAIGDMEPNQQNGKDDAGQTLGRILVKDGDDPWMRAAALSSAPPHATAALLVVFESSSSKRRVVNPIIIESLIGLATLDSRAQGPGGLRALWRQLSTPQAQGFEPWQLAAAVGFLDELDRSKRSLASIVGQAEQEASTRRLSEEAQRLLTASQAPVANRVLAARLLGRPQRPNNHYVDTLIKCLSLQENPVLQQAAVNSLARMGDDQTPTRLLASWRGSTPGTRGKILGVLLDRAGWTSVLLDALDRGEIAVTELSTGDRRRLLDHSDASIRTRVKKRFAAVSVGREEVLKRYESALATARGDSQRGLAVFRKVCVNCHRYRGEGFEIGPDLAALNDRSLLSLVVAVLDPNRAVESKYQTYAVATTDGRVLNGVILAESANGITLGRERGETLEILRTEIESLSGSGKSMMPENIENDLAPQDLADVIAYLNSGGPTRKSFPNNQPVLIRSNDSGVMRLSASAAEVFGSTLVFEQTYKNLGYWSSADDHAVWEIEVPRAGRYEATMEYACPKDAAGNRLWLDVGGTRLESLVQSTGTWDDYAYRTLGQVSLSAGRNRVEARAAVPLRGTLLDLREVILKPIASNPVTEESK